MRKVSILKDIETEIQASAKYQADIDYSKPKFMATFPYPYMNGKLHLGHAFTMLKVDFECRWKELNGYNILFPFGFHCTGMPICGAAKKLEKEINSGVLKSNDPNKKSQWDILTESGVSQDEIVNFIDHKYWVSYFPEIGQTHVKKLGVMADLSRSFVTTDVNPFYDSFVRWQFNKLFSKGYLKFGTRNSIYSESLGIQCQDHDRSQGEGVQTSDYKILEIEFTNTNETESNKTNQVIWVPYQHNLDTKDLNIQKINISKDTTYNLYIDSSNGKHIYMTPYLHTNIANQKDELVNSLKLKEMNATIEVNNIKKYSNIYSYYLGGDVVLGPDSTTTVTTDKSFNYHILDFTIELATDLVIDRMDQVCIVKPLAQWYIDYANPEWKAKTINCVNSMKLTEPVKNGLLDTIDWIKEWGVSRPFGLGTKLPTDNNYLIDSLSDSTIYPAYYTISNILHRDLYGKQSDFDPKDFTDQVWDYIFLSKDFDTKYNCTIDKSKLDLMRDTFNYFYPVDIRISGKDLLRNHLGMYLFNHVAIFEQKHWPVSINCNGWILVNGQKMAKSLGNFITIESATETNSVDAVRMSLADSGDGMDDANYLTSNAGDHCTLKLHSWIELIEKQYILNSNTETNSNEYTDLDKMVVQVFNKMINEIKDHYQNYRYKMVLRDGFHMWNNLREKYRILCKYSNKNMNQQIVNTFIKYQVQLLYPIIPHICTWVWKNKLGMTTSMYISNDKIELEKESLDQWDLMENVTNNLRERVEKLKKKGKQVNSVKVQTPQLNNWVESIVKAQFKFEIAFELADKIYIGIN